jgi:DNA protecting protein DprA
MVSRNQELRTDSISSIVSAIAAGAGRLDGWVPVDATLSALVDQGVRLESLLEWLPTDPTALEATAADLERLHTGDPLFAVADVTSTDYPHRLRLLDRRPLVLYRSGELPDESLPAVAIVGSRQPTEAGREAAFSLARELAARSVVVVSGMAEGIDTAAHLGALSIPEGITLAVVGTGLDQVFPISNADLASRIPHHGAVISQFPAGAGRSKTSFPARNAVIAALSDVSVLIELSERSGTRIEANCALEQGKTVLLWGPILRRCAWTVEFARNDRVHYVENVDGVLEHLHDRIPIMG